MAVVSEEEGVGLGIACHPPTTSSQQLSAPVCVQLGGVEEGQVKLMNTNGPGIGDIKVNVKKIQLHTC